VSFRRHSRKLAYNGVLFLERTDLAIVTTTVKFRRHDSMLRDLRERVLPLCDDCATIARPLAGWRDFSG